MLMGINSHNSSTNLPTYRTSINISGNSTIRSPSLMNNAAQATPTTATSARLPAAARFSLQVVEFDEENIDTGATGAPNSSPPQHRTPPPIPARRSTLSTSPSTGGGGGASSRTLSAATSAPILRSMFSKARQATTVSRSADVSRKDDVDVLCVMFLFLNLSFLLGHRRSNLADVFGQLQPPPTPAKTKKCWQDEDTKDKAASPDEHIYEELDIYSSARTSLPPPSHPPPLPPSATTSGGAGGAGSSSFFANRISRAEILDYLHDARGRLEKKIKEMEDALEDEEEEDVLIEDDYDDNKLKNDEDDEEEVPSSKPQVSPTAGCLELSTNDSGNSSLCLGEEYADTMTCFMATSAAASKTKGKPPGQQYHHHQRQKVLAEQTGQTLLTSTPVTAAHRRNRVSNVSNASSESSGTSGVSVSALDDTEDDGITTSSSSLGSVSGNFSPTGTYYGTGTSTRSNEECGGGVGVGNVLTRENITSTSIERNDSGVGVDLGKSPLTLQVAKGSATLKMNIGEMDTTTTSATSTEPMSCFDCDHFLLQQRPAEQLELCTRCQKRRNERKEIISELADTELKYGRDLKIILEEFARPISVAGLLTRQQVADIFLNLDQLIELNCAFADRLRSTLDAAVERGDEVSLSMFATQSNCF